MQDVLNTVLQQFGGQLGAALLGGNLGGQTSTPQANLTGMVLEQIIKSYVTKNAAITTASALPAGVPGAGLAGILTTALPELLGVTRNNAAMVSDLSAAQNKPMNTMGIVSLLLSSFDISSKGLQFKGNEVVMQQLSHVAADQAVHYIAKKTGSQFLASAAPRLVPVIGALALGAWSAYSTNKIGKNTANILKMNLIQAPDTIDDLELSDYQIQPAAENVNYHKCLVLSNLMKIDGKADRSELTYIEKIIEGIEINSDALEDLYGKLDSPEKHTPDFALIKRYPDEVEGLLFDLVALTRKDGNIAPAEQNYILQVGAALGVDADNIKVMF